MPKNLREVPGQYTPALWEKVVATTVAVCSFGIVALLVIRNQPFADPNLVVLLRIVLSVAAAVLGATIPGFLYVNWKGKGLVVRAGGALALFVIVYFFSPAVVKSEGKKLGLNDIQIRFEVSAWQLTENDLSRAPKVIPCRGKIEQMSIDFDLVLIEALDHASSPKTSVIDN